MAFDRGMTRAQENQEGDWEKNQEIKGFKISFKKEHLSKKVSLLLCYKQTLRPHTLLCYVIQITFLNLFKSTWSLFQ